MQWHQKIIKKIKIKMNKNLINKILKNNKISNKIIIKYSLKNLLLIILN